MTQKNWHVVECEKWYARLNNGPGRQFGTCQTLKVHTKSELVFEDYCRERGYRSERIEPEINSGQFPDYRVITPAGQ